MDLKTLEYLEDKTREARDIVNQIAELNEQLENMEKVEEVAFQGDFKDNVRFFAKNKTVHTLKKTYLETIKEEIRLLKEDLASI